MAKGATALHLEDVRTALLQRRSRSSRSRFWNTALFIVAIIVVDVYGIFYFVGGSPARYAIILLPLFLICVVRGPLTRLTIRPPELPDYLLLTLLVYGGVGSTFGIVFGLTPNPALPLFLPMVLGLLHLTTLGPVEEPEASAHLRRWVVLGCVYTAVATASALGMLELIGGGGADPSTNVVGAAFAHEKAFFLCLALAGAWLLKRRKLFVLLLAGALLGFFTYPAATYLVAAVVTVMTLVATGRRSGRVRAWTMAILCLLFFAVVVKEVTTVGPQAREGIGSRYFEAVGKSDNSETRAELWGDAWDELKESPIVGSGFTRDLTLRVWLEGKRRSVPPHNDYLQLGMGGGLLGMGLLLGWVGTTNLYAHRRFRRVVSEGSSNCAILLRLLMVGYNSFFAIALLNPVLSRLGLSVTAMLLYAMIMTVRAPSVGAASGR